MLLGLVPRCIFMKAFACYREQFFGTPKPREWRAVLNDKKQISLISFAMLCCVILCYIVLCYASASICLLFGWRLRWVWPGKKRWMMTSLCRGCPTVTMDDDFGWLPWSMTSTGGIIWTKTTATVPVVLLSTRRPDLSELAE